LTDVISRRFNEGVMDIFDRLEYVIRARRADTNIGATSSPSYIATLQAEGPATIAQKFGEEAIETIIAALEADPQSLVSEAADLLFHLLILLDARNVSLADVRAELERREGRSGLDEKAARTGRKG
jgi:phosphoribosyl-ATP pyrophosphohydrolase